MKMKKILTLVLVSALGGVLSLIGYKSFIEEDQVIAPQETQHLPKFIPASYATPNTNFTTVETPDFVSAAEKTIHTVVHVKNTTIPSNNLTAFELFFSRDRAQKPQIGTGSGVIISADGYIVTNNHVIDGAQSISITTNDNKIYDAELIGTDEETDIALLKIDTDEELAYTSFGDSDTAKIGEWVLAVGNPFNLTSTVTAGIISAKSRDLSGDRKRQSFIQTDAAVNPGNSGGALVNTNGDLIGINTAITSQTGSYVGYSFAVPSNIARKVVEDLLEFGDVQNGILGVNGAALNSKNAQEEYNTDITEGFYVAEVFEDSGASKAGVQSGDIITKLDNVTISKFSDLSGYLTTKGPNDIVNLTILRNGTKKIVPVTLTKDESSIEILGMSLRDIPERIKEKNDLKEGVVVSESNNRQLRVNFGVGRNYIITGINDTPIYTIKDIAELKEKHGASFEDDIYKLEIMDPYGRRKEINFQ